MPPREAGRAVQTNAELKALHASGAGFIYSHYSSGPSGSQYNLLHTAGCDGVGKMIAQAKPEARPTYRKRFFRALDEALAWLVSNRGPEGHGWRRCRTCQPGGHPAAGGSAPWKHDARPDSARDTKETADPMSGQARMFVSGSWPVHAAFAMPSSPPLPLPVPPRLASWNKGGDPDQVRLAAYLDVADKLLRPYYERLSGQVALRLDVGLPHTAALLDQRDLDNYLFPLATHINLRIPGILTCAWGTKQHSASSFVRIEQAVPATAGPSIDSCYTVRTTASSQSTAFKEQIRDQLGTTRPLPPGPVQMQLCFTVGPGRNWMSLWKPAIDALGPVLGHAPGTGPWAPLDGRIVDLGLHCQVDPDLGNQVLIAIAAARRQR